MRELFVGKSVVEAGVITGVLLLNDGTVLEVVPNEYGCGGCSSGHYEITELNGCENIITNVELVTEEEPINSWDKKTTYSLFVLAEDKRINLIKVEGDDGNGYYGTGYWIKVRKSTKSSERL